MTACVSTSAGLGRMVMVSLLLSSACRPVEEAGQLWGPPTRTRPPRPAPESTRKLATR
jgi:hypothetical protein